MPQSYSFPAGTPNVTVTIPELVDDANIVAALQTYHQGVSTAIVGKANIAGQAFTGAISSTGTITANGGVITTNVVTLVGQANAAISAGRYISGTGTANVLANSSSAVRVFISQANPNGCTTALTTGDIWISWS